MAVYLVIMKFCPEAFEKNVLTLSNTSSVIGGLT